MAYYGAVSEAMAVLSCWSPILSNMGLISGEFSLTSAFVNVIVSPIVLL